MEIPFFVDPFILMLLPAAAYAHPTSKSSVVPVLRAQTSFATNENPGESGRRASPVQHAAYVIWPISCSRCA